MKLAFEKLAGDAGFLVHTDTGLPKIPELQAHRWRDGQEIVLLLPDAAPEDQNFFIALAQIPGVVSVQTVSRYQILFTKGRLFEWAPIREHIIQACADRYDSMIEIVPVATPAARDWRELQKIAHSTSIERIETALARDTESFDAKSLQDVRDALGGIQMPVPVGGHEPPAEPTSLRFWYILTTDYGCPIHNTVNAVTMADAEEILRLRHPSETWEIIGVGHDRPAEGLIAWKGLHGKSLGYSTIPGSKASLANMGTGTVGMSATPPLTIDQIKTGIEYQYVCSGSTSDSKLDEIVISAMSIDIARQKLVVQHGLTQYKIAARTQGRPGDPRMIQGGRNSWS